MFGNKYPAIQALKMLSPTFPHSTRAVCLGICCVAALYQHESQRFPNSAPVHSSQDPLCLLCTEFLLICHLLPLSCMFKNQNHFANDSVFWG